MERAINGILNSVVGETGKIIGIRLALRLVRDDLERVRALNREISDLEFTDRKVMIRLRPDVSRKRSLSILRELAEAVMEAYSGVMGEVARSLVRRAIILAAMEYEREYPELKGFLRTTKRQDIGPL